MNKFDIVEKIPISRLLKALVVKTKSPVEALKDVSLIKDNWQVNYFNWGRNALYTLFKKLPYKTIHLPAFTCPVLTDAVLASNKKVELLKVDLETFNLDFNKLPKKAPECLVAVHTFGNPIDIGLLKKHYPKAFIIEDCAHSLFSKINNQLVGSKGDAVLFSLYKQVANLNGALLLTKKDLNLKQNQEKLTSFWPRIIFKTKGFHHIVINLLRHRYIDTLEKRGFDEKTSPHWLFKRLFVLGFKGLAEKAKKRQQAWQWYEEGVKNSRYLRSQKIDKGNESSAYQFVVYLKARYAHVRDQVVWNLRKQNIFLDRLWYSAPITEKRFANFQKTCPKALQLANSVISLPVDPKFKKRDIEFLIKKLNGEIENIMSNKE